VIRLADYVIHYLEGLGVTEIFTVSGGGSIFLCDALAQSQKIRYVCCHHEQAVAMATEAYARVRQSLGVSLVTSGPGGTNAITGVAGSWTDSVPHLTISGQVFLKQTIGNSGLRQLGIQEINIVDLVRPITKYAHMVTEPRSIRYHLEKAVHRATCGRPGPAWLDIPADLQNAKIDDTTLGAFSSTECPECNVAEEADFAEKVRTVAKLLTSAKRPFIHVGQGVRIAGAVKDFLQFVEQNQLPFATARNANDLIASDHELYIGRPGTFGQRAANFALQNADVYLAVGTRLSLAQTGYSTEDFARNATRVIVDISQPELEKHVHVHLKIRADARAFLMALNRQLDGAAINVAEWLAQCRWWKQKYAPVSPEYYQQRGSVNSYVFIDILSDLLSPGDVVVTDMGYAFQNTHQAFRVKPGQRLVTNCGMASMGWGLPAAVGACFAHGQRRTICIAGDGGLTMTIQELATVMHHRLPIKLFIFNNGGYLTMKQSQEFGFGGRLMGANHESGLSFPDMLKIAEAHRIPAARIASHEDLRRSVQAALEAPGPFVCELMMDHSEHQVKAINRRLPDGTIKQTSLEDLYPFLDPKEVEANMRYHQEQVVAGNQGER